MSHTGMRAETQQMQRPWVGPCLVCWRTSKEALGEMPGSKGREVFAEVLEREGEVQVSKVLVDYGKDFRFYRGLTPTLFMPYLLYSNLLLSTSNA